MTAEDLLDAYRDEMAPTLGLAFIEGFIARNRSSMLRMLAPLVALMNARMRPHVQGGVLTIYRQGSGGLADINIQESVGSLADASARYRRHVEDSYEGFSTFPMGRLLLNGQHYRVSYNGRVWAGDPERGHPIPNDVQGPAFDPLGHDADGQDPDDDEDPDAVTPEKDAIVWAAFEDLVEQKKRELGIRRGPDPKPQRKPRAKAERKPVEAIDAASLKSAIISDSLSEGQRSALRDIILQQPEAALRVAAIGGNEASIPNAQSVVQSLDHLDLGIDVGDLRHAWMVAMQAIDPMVAKTNAINQTDEVPRHVLEKIGFDNYTREEWRRLFMGAFDSAIERLYPGDRPSLDLEAVLWSRVFAREVLLAALGVKPSLEELLPTGSDELASGIKKWLASTGEVVESLRSCRSCRPSSRRIREAEERGRNAVHYANIADAGLTAAWSGVTESMPFFGRRKPDRKEIVEYIQEIKETRKGDWRLAERLASYFEVPETKVVEWLNEFNVCPGATVRTMASKCDPSRYKAPKKADGWLSRTLSGRPKREVIVKAIREMKRERRSDWHLAPSLGGHFGVPDETIVEWLRHYDICPGATTRSMASQCVIEDVESMPSRTPIAITLRHPKRRDLVAMVTASASEPGRYQLTWADNDGPSGHTTRDTPEAAVRHAIEEGYRLDTANSAEAREMVERVQQERERRAAEIESWLTESLPSTRHTGRMPGNECSESLPSGADHSVAWARSHPVDCSAYHENVAIMRQEWPTNDVDVLRDMFIDMFTPAQEKMSVAVRFEEAVVASHPEHRGGSGSKHWRWLLSQVDAVFRALFTGKERDLRRLRDYMRDMVGAATGANYGSIAPVDVFKDNIRHNLTYGPVSTAAMMRWRRDDPESYFANFATMWNWRAIVALQRGYISESDLRATLPDSLRRPDVQEVLSQIRGCLGHGGYREEGLPSPKDTGRMGDGFKVGEHVIRIGDMIKMEGQLGGYVENVDRSKGIARIEQDNGEITTWPLASLLHDTKASRERQQEHNDKINAEAEARLELSLADWGAPELTESTPSLRMKDGRWSV